MRITIVAEHGAVEVWTSLVGDDDPRQISESFIIGSGATLREAVDSALEELHVAAAELQAAKAAL